MDTSSLRELGCDLFEDRQFEKALAVFAEAVRRVPNDHRSRMRAAECLSELGEEERAVSVLHACAEGLLRRDFLLSAMASCRMALALSPSEKRVRETLGRIHARALRSAPGKASVPPPLPPESIYQGDVQIDLMSLSGSDLFDAAIEVLGAPDTHSLPADPNARPPLPLFAQLTLDAFVELVEQMSLRSVKEGDTICEESQGGETLFVLVAGRALVTRKFAGEEKALGVLGGGSIFGEVSLLTGTPPTSTVSAVADAEVFEIRREHLNALAKRHPEVMATLAEFAQQRMAKSLMATSPLFQSIPEVDRMAMLQRFSFRALAPNERCIVEGEYAPGLFLVLAGELVVQKEDPAGGSVALSVLREGDIAGEISLLRGLRATATVAASRKAATAFLERGAFESLMDRYQTLRSFLEALSDRRLKMIGEALRPSEIIDADDLVEDAPQRAVS